MISKSVLVATTTEHRMRNGRAAVAFDKLKYRTAQCQAIGYMNVCKFYFLLSHYVKYDKKQKKNLFASLYLFRKEYTSR